MADPTSAPKGPLSYVHQCLTGCASEGAEGQTKPAETANPTANGSAAAPPNFQPAFPGQPQFPGALAPIRVTLQGFTGPNGEQLFHHPHYPHLRADVCKGCRQVVPIRPPKVAQSLTKQQLHEFQECFQMFDKDGDGTIDTKELGAVMRSLGQFPDEEEIEEMVDDADEDGSGSVNFQEFVTLMLKRQSGGMTREEIKQVIA